MSFKKGERERETEQGREKERGRERERERETEQRLCSVPKQILKVRKKNLNQKI